MSNAQWPDSVITPSMLDSLAKSRFWIRIVAALGFLAAAGLAACGLFAGTLGVGLFSDHTEIGWAMLLFAGALSLVGLLLFIPSAFLLGYASAITRALAAEDKASAIEAALQKLRNFWTVIGMIVILGIVLLVPSAITALVTPNVLQRRSFDGHVKAMADMRMISETLEMFRKDRGGYPEAATLDGLQRQLSRYSTALPARDPWGNAYRYGAVGCEDGTCWRYFLISAGSDGKFERDEVKSYEGAAAYGTTTPESDIVHTNGAFLIAPVSAR